jgi:hypothetical protein
MRKILELLALTAFSSPVLADSDGYFCIGPDYLAYEMTFSVNPSGHRLYILRFDNPAAWDEPLRVDLPEFNGPPMRCEAQAIVLAGWDEIHHVAWQAESPHVVSLRSEPKEPGPSDMSKFPDSIGSVVFGIPGPIEVYSAPLPSDDPVYSYRLTVSRTRDPVRPCSWNVRSFIAQYVFRDVVAEFDLFAGQTPAECAE